MTLLLVQALAVVLFYCLCYWLVRKAREAERNDHGYPFI